MAGVSTILRLLIVPILIMVLMLVTAVTFRVLEPLKANLDFSAAAALGWPTGQAVLFFASLSLIGLGLAMIVWLWYAPIREDVRQEVRGPF